jgi:hypothetical protein
MRPPFTLQVATIPSKAALEFRSLHPTEIVSRTCPAINMKLIDIGAPGNQRLTS